MIGAHQVYVEQPKEAVAKRAARLMATGGMAGAGIEEAVRMVRQEPAAITIQVSVSYA